MNKAAAVLCAGITGAHTRTAKHTNYSDYGMGAISMQRIGAFPLEQLCDIRTVQTRLSGH